MRHTILTAVTAGLLAVAPGPVHAEAEAWTIDPNHTRVEFSVPHMVISDVEGRFKDVSGEVRIDEKKPQNSSVRLEIDASSIDTDNDKRDEHLRSADFFDVKKHPKLTFESTKIEKAGKGYKVTGNLTIHGVTKPVTLKVELSKALKDPWGKMVRAAQVTGKLNRKNFGLTWNKALEAGGFLVGDEVTLDIRVELQR